jgi:regulatory protein
LLFSRQEAFDAFKESTPLFYLRFLHSARFADHRLSHSHLCFKPSIYDQDKTKPGLGHISSMPRAENSNLTQEQIIKRLETYCAYRERCEAEVRQKLYALKADVHDYDFYLDYLRGNNYLNEDRFIAAYARGKFNIKSWGRKKIADELRAKNIPDKEIQRHIGELDEGMYFLKLQELLGKKAMKIKEGDAYKKRQKLILYAIQKGYEAELVSEAIKALRL